MRSDEIRRKFLDYFAAQGHTVVPSSSLVPGNDPTLLFVNSGMVQFKDSFLGLEQRPYVRAATSQKSMRVSGKHNDLENVGPSPRHHTFFEMLGNFSFGDYFKRDAIRFAWDFLVNEMKLDVNRLWFSVFEGSENVPADEEAVQLWIEAGADPSRILRFGEKDNFWAMGETGPCGPNSEIHYYQGDHPESQMPEGVNSEDDMYMEIWNLVFMQYNRDEHGNLTPLPKQSVDTGMGFERITAVMQGVTSNYKTDLFVPIIERTRELLGTSKEHYEQNYAAYHAIADHARATAFLIADGLRPGNEGREYVLRRILRRAAYQGQTIGFEKPFMADVADVVIELMGGHYSELRNKAGYIKEVITAEEERFNRTLATGLRHLDAAVAALPKGQTVLPGREAFTLHDTYGFPLDLTEKILGERQMEVDSEGYEAARREQQERGRSATQFKRGSAAARWGERELPRTSFSGYRELHSFGRVLALEIEQDGAHAVVETVSEGQQIQLVLDHTPFYAESGGQVADTGVIVGPSGRVRVTDVQKPIPDLYVHTGVVEAGTLAAGEKVELQVDARRRRDIMRNHTATHLLHRALRDTLGEHAEQAGSLVAPDRLRFDFTHQRAISQEQLRQIERAINTWVRDDRPVEVAEMAIDQARAMGAMALFGEKYGDFVRMVSVGCPDADHDAEAHPAGVKTLCSRELCGGTHVAHTGEIGYFRIISEGSIGSGLRRIEALTGAAAEELVDQQSQTIRDLAQRLSAQPGQVVERIEALLAELKTRNAELATLRTKLASGQSEELVERAQESGGMRFVAAEVAASDVNELRQLAEQVRGRLESGVVVLGAAIDDKPQLVAAVTPDLVKKGVNAGKLVRELAPAIGGGGGGRPELAQAGGKDVSGLPEAISRVPQLLTAAG